MSETILQVNHLSVSFDTYVGAVRAVRDVSFQLHRGETLASIALGAKSLALTALDLIQNPALLSSIKKEHYGLLSAQSAESF